MQEEKCVRKSAGTYGVLAAVMEDAGTAVMPVIDGLDGLVAS